MSFNPRFTEQAVGILHENWEFISIVERWMTDEATTAKPINMNWLLG